MSEIAQLFTAIPFGGGDLSEELVAELADHAPPNWVPISTSIANILFSIVLVLAGMSILQRAPHARKVLLYWSGMFLIFTVVSTFLTWFPRWELVQTIHEVKGMFLAQLFISAPMYLALPVFLLVFLNRQHVRNEISHWR